jgi:hypothetical protein
MENLETMSPAQTDHCWSCGEGPVSPIFSVPSIPLSSLVLMDTADEAKDFPRGGLELVVCRECGFIYNKEFRPEAVDYTLPYESSQDFSPRFRQFKQELIDHLIEDYQLAGKRIFEIGCGDASFLQALCQEAGASGFCIDPTFDEERVTVDGVAGTNVFFDDSTTHLTGDLICCRHTLEHIQPVGEFVGLVKDSAERTPGSVVFFEIPDTERILDEGAFWDVYYEHCSYFTLASLARLFEHRGFRILRLVKGYEDQYLLIDAMVGEPDATVTRPSVQGVLEKAELFRIASEKAISAWKDMIIDAAARGERVVLWGASSKAVAFIASMEADDAISLAVDINPYKQQKYLPGSGHMVVAPQALSESRPDLVIAMNPIYLDEIRDTLDGLGLSPQLHALGEEI